jgi:hypothetical protein
MTPKEKALELFDKIIDTMFDLSDGYNSTEIYNAAKQCALIAVDEIFEFMKMDDEYTDTAYNANSKWVHYWIEVKQEIQKL